MLKEENKTIAQSFGENVWGRGDQEALEELFAPAEAGKRVLYYVALLIVLMLVTSACGGARAQARKITESPYNNEAKSIPAGRYASDEFRPTMSFRLGEGWRTGPASEDSYGALLETSHNLTLSTFSGPGSSFLEFLVVPKVYKVVSSYEAKTQPAPKDILSWLENNPNLDTKKPEPVSIGGLKGKQVDAVPSHIPQEYFGGGYHACGCTGREPSLPLFQVIPGYGEESTYDLYKDEKVRFIVLDDVEGKTVTISVQAPETNFDEFWNKKAQEVLKTVEWKGKSG